jgi:hypothetical protein
MSKIGQLACRVAGFDEHEIAVVLGDIIGVGLNDRHDELLDGGVECVVTELPPPT